MSEYCSYYISKNDSDILSSFKERANQISDAIIIIVSEETGTISLAINGRLTRNYDKDNLRLVLLKIMVFLC